MSAGELRERIAFETQEFVDDPFGGTVSAWSEQFVVAARVQFLRGSEPVLAQRLVGVQPVIIKVRSSTETREITPAWRARDERTGALFQIRSVTPDERRAYIDVLAEKGVAI